MSLWLEEKFLKQISTRLPGFKERGNHVYNFKCVLCGDSSKKRNKKRGYCVAKTGKLFYYCHNCNASLLFTTFLKDFDYNLYKQYSLENFKENSNPTVKEEIQRSIPKTKKYVPDIFENLPLVRDMELSSLASTFSFNRELPVMEFDFYYAENFIDWTKGNTDKFQNWKGADHARLVIPWRDRTGKIIGYSARAFDDTQEQKYYRIFVDDDIKEKFFGLDRINEDEQIFVLEGEIDSLMIPNAIAVSNGKLHTYINKKAIYIPDGDRRNKHICRGISEMIDLGLRVCLLPEDMPKGVDGKDSKDLNDLVIANCTQEEILDIIYANTFNGLEARLKFDKWKKI